MTERIAEGLIVIGVALLVAVVVVTPAVRCWRDGGLAVLSIGYVGCAIPYSLIHSPPTPEPSP